MHSLSLFHGSVGVLALAGIERRSDYDAWRDSCVFAIHYRAFHKQTVKILVFREKPIGRRVPSVKTACRVYQLIEL